MSERRYGLRFYSLVAGFGCITLAAFVQGILPMLEPESRTTKVTKVVRTDLGELKWMQGEATDYTAAGAARQSRVCEGRLLVLPFPVRAAGDRRDAALGADNPGWRICVRPAAPVLDPSHRAGPVAGGAQVQRRLALAHFWDPRMLTPDSIMPRFRGLFEGPYQAKIVDGADGVKTVEKTSATQKLFNFESAEQLLLTPNADGLVFVPERGKYPVIFTPNEEYKGEVVTLVSDTEDLQALVAYVQKLGINRGKWRDRFEPQLTESSAGGAMPRSDEWVTYGKEVYERRCQGCHGEKGDGNGPAAAFMQRDRPRNFTLAVFKFRLTPSGSLPEDGDLLRTITSGVRGTAMPTWHELPEKDRLTVIQYIKYELAVDRSDPEQAVFLSSWKSDPSRRFTWARHRRRRRRSSRTARKSGSRRSAGSATVKGARATARKHRDSRTTSASPFRQPISRPASSSPDRASRTSIAPCRPGSPAHPCRPSAIRSRKRTAGHCLITCYRFRRSPTRSPARRSRSPRPTALRSTIRP